MSQFAFELCPQICIPNRCVSQDYIFRCWGGIFDELRRREVRSGDNHLCMKLMHARCIELVQLKFIIPHLGERFTHKIPLKPLRLSGSHREATLEFGKVIFIAASIGVAASQAHAQCNFDKPIGGCTATLQLQKTGGSKPSFSAEVEITSSAGSCSKVEYFVNSTPYTSIIRTDGVEHESLFGTSPIERGDIQVSKCTAYQDDGSGSEKQDAAHAAASKIPVDGSWHSVHDLGASGTHETTLTFKETNGKISVKEKMVAYWGPDSNRKKYSQVMTSGARWTAQRNGNVITTSSGATTFTIIDEHTLNQSDGTVWNK